MENDDFWDAKHPSALRASEPRVTNPEVDSSSQFDLPDDSSSSLSKSIYKKKRKLRKPYLNRLLESQSISETEPEPPSSRIDSSLWSDLQTDAAISILDKCPPVVSQTEPDDPKAAQTPPIPDIAPEQVASETTTQAPLVSDMSTHITENTEPSADSRPSHGEDVPWPGNVFVIRHKTTGKAMTLFNGKLCLRLTTEGMGGYYWKCVEKDGWLGFRNVVSGTYLGRASTEIMRNWPKPSKIKAIAPDHGDSEYFCASHHPQGGYVLLVKVEHRISQLAVESDEDILEVATNGTMWCFTVVKGAWTNEA